MANLISVQGKYATNDYRDVKALGIGGSSSDLALAIAGHVKDSDTGLWVPMETDHLRGSSIPASVVSGTVALTTTGAALPSVASKVVMLQNSRNNTMSVFVGDNGSQDIEIIPGDTFVAEISNLSAIYAKSESGTPDLAYFVTV